MRRFFFASVMLTTGLIAGCSQNTDDLFQSGSQGGASTSSVTTGSPSTNASTSANTSGKTTSVATTNNVTNGPTTNATTNTVGPTVTTAATTTVNVVSASTGSGPTVDCGGAGSCDVQSSVCCYDHSTLGAMCTPQHDCQPSGGSQPTAITCQSPQDCPGQQLCCAVRYGAQDTQPYQYTQCQNQCNLPNRILCDINNPDCPVYTNSMGQPQQSICKASMILPAGYYICGF